MQTKEVKKISVSIGVFLLTFVNFPSKCCLPKYNYYHDIINDMALDTADKKFHLVRINRYTRKIEDTVIKELIGPKTLKFYKTYPDHPFSAILTRYTQGIAYHAFNYFNESDIGAKQLKKIAQQMTINPYEFYYIMYGQKGCAYYPKKSSSMIRALSYKLLEIVDVIALLNLLNLE